MTNIVGVEGIRKLFNETLKNKEKILRSALSGRPLVYLIDNNFAEQSMINRCEANIYLKSLRFSSKVVDLPRHKEYKKYNKEVRMAPKEIMMQESILIWDDKVAIVNTKNVQGVIIENKGNADAMKSWFDYIWANSK